MKIIDNSVNEEKYFRDLMCPDVFKFDDRLFMKVSNNYDGAHNSYDFTKGRLTNIIDETKVQYIPSELILHERGWDQTSENVH